MRPISFILLFLIFGWRTPPEPPPSVADTLIIALEDGWSLHQVVADFPSLTRSNGSWPIKTLSAEAKYYLLWPPASHSGILQELRNHPGVRLAQKNHPVRLREQDPTDPYWEEQWDMRRIGLPAVWDFTSTVPVSRTPTHQVLVGVLEKNGFDLDHEDLRDQFWENPGEIPADGLDNDQNGLVDDSHGWNFHLEESIHAPDQHGTKVAGLIGAGGNNGRGISGTHWNVGLIPLSGLHYEHQIVRAYLYLRDLRRQYNDTGGREGAFVVATNASFGVNYGHPADYPIWCEVFDKLGEVGILSVSSVVNAPVDVDVHHDIPTSCASDFLITVTESNYEDQLPSDAAYGTETVDLAAPGRGSFTTFPNNRYGIVDRGTSFAAPHVSGTIALLYSRLCGDLHQEVVEHPQHSARKIKEVLMKGSSQLPAFSDKVKSGGRLDAGQSYRLLNRYCRSHLPEWKMHRVFPNPFNQEVEVSVQVLDAGPFSFRLFNAQGRQVADLQQQMPAGNDVRRRLNLSGLPPGLYTLIIRGGGRETTHRLVKVRP